MLEVVFHGADGIGAIRLSGPLGISLDHGTIDAAGPVLASHGTPGWKVGELLIRRISCGGPIYLELRDEQRVLGPFSALEIGAETISTADGPFASYDALAQRWQLSSKRASVVPPARLTCGPQ
jgi:hypothetical protein